MTDLLEAFVARSSAAGILLDFDGTLSQIVEVPSDARPYPGVAEILPRLAETYGHVAIVSGRSAVELVDWLGEGIDIWGVHGAERSRPGESHVTLSPLVQGFEETMARVRREARRRLRDVNLPGTLVEDKRVMIGLHFRAAEEPERAREALRLLARELASKYGLWQAGGRMAFELRPPVKLSKGHVVESIAREANLQAVLFAGDDTVDVPGFAALDRLADEGVLGVRVGVISNEAPPELLERADLKVQGPVGMLELLQRLV